MKFGDWALLHREEIARDGRPYLTRWRLIQTPLFAAYLHRFWAPDHDEDFHDHPWDFVSIVLAGGYVEERGWPLRVERRGRGSVAYRRAEDLHRIASVIVPTWTLVLCGRRRREWGFQTPHGWVQWEEYLTGKEVPG